MLFAILCYIPTAVIEERKVGTVQFTLNFLILSTFINILTVAFGLIVGYAF